MEKYKASTCFILSSGYGALIVFALTQIPHLPWKLFTHWDIAIRAVIFPFLPITDYSPSIFYCSTQSQSHIYQASHNLDPCFLHLTS